jgi:hypothetical protein
MALPVGDGLFVGGLGVLGDLAFDAAALLAVDRNVRAAEAHVVRLAMIYALLGCSQHIGAEHLGAALAIWRYSTDSGRWIFGDSLGGPTADEIWVGSEGAPLWGHTDRGCRL